MEENNALCREPQNQTRDLVHLPLTGRDPEKPVLPVEEKGKSVIPARLDGQICKD